MRTTAGQIIALAIIFFFVSAFSPAASKVQDSLAKWSQGKRIQVVLNSGEQLIGRLGLVQPETFALETDKGTGTARILRFDEVRSVRAKMTKAQKWGVAGAVYAGLCAIGIVLGK